MSAAATDLAAALALHRAGRLAEAEQVYRDHLAAAPDDALALHNLGVIAIGRGDHARAIELIGRALELRPRFIAGHAHLGDALAALDRLEEAQASFERALSLAPNSIDALAGLASLHQRRGRWADAVSHWQTAIAAAPDRLELRHNLGLALADAGRLDEGIATIEAVLAKKGDFAAAHNNLCALLRRAKRLPEAIAAGSRAVALTPQDPTAQYNLAMARCDAGDQAGAISGLERSAELRPDYVDALTALGLLYRDTGRIEVALGWLQRAASTDPRNADVIANLGASLQEADRLDEAIATYRRALAIDGQGPEIHLNHGLALLTAGRFAEGWPEYEWRTRCAQPTGARLEFTKPAWDGGDVGGQRILLHAEQGYGDTIQFLRYAPLVKAAGATVIVECQPALRRLAARMAGAGVVVERGKALPEYDLHAPLLSLPRLMGTGLATIPAPIGYLSADPRDVDRRGMQLSAIRGLRVGIAWQGNPQHKADRRRSLPLDLLAGAIRQQGIRPISLQIGHGREQIETVARDQRPYDPFVELPARDFADTAALIANLDLVIAVDTAVAHLSAAMGRTTWILLPRIGDWRWLERCDDSPWYPTVRLFRQQRQGDWNEALERLAQALAGLVSNRGLP